MDIELLRNFLEIARLGSMTKAASSLHISQPTLSVQMKSLEEVLGRKLFRKEGRNLVMTEEGETGVIGGRRLSGGGISFAGSKMLKSEEAFQTMRQWTYENIQNAAAQIAEGYYPIAPSPCADPPPCRYCSMRPICANCADS